MYIVPEDPIRVNYAKFIEDVEIVFTKSVNIIIIVRVWTKTL
jgi:hypothetical protein